MTERVRSGLQFGIGMSVFFVLKNLYDTSVFTTAGIFRSVIGGIIAGAFAGFLFGWITGAAWYRRLTKTEKNPE